MKGRVFTNSRAYKYLEPPGVQECNIPHFKGLMIERAQAQGRDGNITIWPRPFEKGHFTPKMAKGVIFIFLNCM